MIMKYNVINRTLIGENTAVTILGNGEGLKNNIMINENRHKVISVGMVNSKTPFKTTILLVEGKFEESEISI